MEWEGEGVTKFDQKMSSFSESLEKRLLPPLAKKKLSEKCL